MNLIDSLQTGTATTANGAVTHTSTLSACLDMFFLAGASRSMSDKDILSVFTKAYGEDPRIALKILFWARDVRGGAGERKFFRVCWRYAFENYPVSHLLALIPEYGRWDDIFFNVLEAKDKDAIVAAIIDGLEDSAKAGLLAKWLPRKGEVQKLLCERLHVSPKEWRKKIVSLSKTVEQLMCAKEWKAISYKGVPSVAMHKYKKSFYRNDETRFTEFIEMVNEGKVEMNAKTLFPYQLYQSYKKGENQDVIRAQWKNLAEYGGEGNILTVCDTSGSMTNNEGVPMAVSVSLGVYISERVKGAFQDCFITFSDKPKLQKLNGDIIQRFMQLENAEWEQSTNLVAVFELLLQVALRDKIPQAEMPSKILIISDMEFNSCASFGGYRSAQTIDPTNFQKIKEIYAQHGYEMPYIIFWNVNGRIGNVPAQRNDYVGLVSGFSPSLLQSILKGELYTPAQLMLETVDVARYAPIVLD